MVIAVTVMTNAMSIYKSRTLTKTPLTIHSVQLLNGSLYQIKSNKPILIDFWATWCPVCKVEASNIAFLSKYFEVITVVVKSGDDAKIRKFMQKHRYHFKVVNDAKGLLASKFKIAGFPTTFIYNKEHKLAFSDVGYSSTLTLYLKMLWAEKE